MRLPGVRPVRLVDDARREVADRPQPERLEMAELAVRPRDRARARPPASQQRQVGPDHAPAGSRSTRAAEALLHELERGLHADVPPGAARDRISDTASTASWSAATASSSQAPGVAAAAARSMPASGSGVRTRRVASAGRAARHPRPSFSRRPLVLGDRVARLLRVRLEQLALLLRQLRRDDDVGDDVEVAARRRAGAGAARRGRGAGSRSRAGCRA